MEEDQRAERAAAGKREVRWSARRKEEVVMRLLRGESLDLLARETGQPAGRISTWREEFLAAGREGLKSRPAEPEDRSLAKDSPLTGESHRKVWARLRRRGVNTSRKRVLRLTREGGLLAPTPEVRRRAKRLHSGTITLTEPDTLWATDATEGHSEEGRSAVSCIVDHATGEAWADASLRMDRFAAADLLREACARRFGSVERAVCSGLALRYDGGPCFRAAHYQAEIDHLGIARSPAYHYEPETNGCVEKFIQTLKEQVLWIERFATHEQLRRRVRAFARTYNREWLIERHGFLTPLEAREHLLRQVAVA